MPFPRRRTLNIPLQLRALNLPAFVGRQHSGIDVGIFSYFNDSQVSLLIMTMTLIFVSYRTLET